MAQRKRKNGASPNIRMLAALVATEAKLCELAGRSFKDELAKALTELHTHLNDDVILRVKKELSL